MSSPLYIYAGENIQLLKWGCITTLKNLLEHIHNILDKKSKL